MSSTRRGSRDRLAPAPSRAAADHRSGREKVVDIQRARMLAAMTHVVAERGAPNVTVADIVARSGVSRRTFYEVFQDREECFLAAFNQAVRRTASVVLPAYEESGSWRVRIRAGLTSLLCFIDHERDIGRLMIVESPAGGAGALEHRQGVIAKITAVIDEGRLEAKRGDGLPPLTAEGVVGGVLSVLHSRLVGGDGGSLLDLTGALMSMIVLPYLGMSAAQRELERPIPRPLEKSSRGLTDPLRELEMRLTYRTVRVLSAVAAHPGASNRQVGRTAGIEDQGQISKLLARLGRLGLVDNTDVQAAKGTANAWTLTPTGERVQDMIAAQIDGLGVLKAQEEIAEQSNGMYAPKARSHV